MRHAIVLSILAAVPLRAQSLEPNDPRAGFLVDTVISTVNNEVIMLSELRTLVVPDMATRQRILGRALTIDEKNQLRQKHMRDLIEGHTMAQAAKTLGLAPPSLIENLFQDELRRIAAEQVRSLGTEQRFSEELQRSGRTWQSFERQQRVDTMRRFAEELAISSRLQRQQNLWLTPRMMRELYRSRIDQFVRPSLALVSAVVFRGDQAAENARRAIEMWRIEEISSQQLADRFPGTTSTSGIDASTLVPTLPLARFGLAGPQGAVSEPMPWQGGLQVAKVDRFLAARNGKFEDPDVQTELRLIGLRQIEEELRQQALLRAAARAEIEVLRPR